ncbi:MAG: hypothetical protein Q9217_001927 [Psora testacea]
MLIIIAPAAERGLIRSKIDAAFTRIDLTATELNKVVTKAPDANKDVTAAATLLFNTADFGKVANNLRNVYDVSHVGKDAVNDDSNSGTVAFNDAKVDDGKGKQVLADATWYFNAGGDIYDGCFNKKHVEMYTTVAEDISKAKPSVIQICPWYLERFLNPPAEKKCPKWQTKLKSVMDTLAFAKKTPVDGYTDFVQTMVHELTHTKAGGRTNDSGPKGIKGFLAAELFNKDSYGWANCVSLRSSENADS